ncbi:hypothetical protein JCM8547_009414 [Rhodosporidiobolus lusitaniae]
MAANALPNSTDPIVDALREWTEIEAAADNLVASILAGNMDLHQDIARMQASIQPRATPVPSVSMEEVEAGTLANKAEEQALSESVAAVRALASTVPARPAPTTHVEGPPINLIVFDAATAVWDYGAVQRGKGGGRDMEHDIKLEGDSALKPGDLTLLSFAFLDKKALLGWRLTASFRSDDRTWEDFIAGFMDLPQNHIIDTNGVDVNSLIGDAILCMGAAREVKRIYIAGLNVDNLRSAVPQLNKSTSAFYTTVGPKIVLINHRESEDEYEALSASGWRVTEWPRYFSSNIGLGGDQGWRFRPASPVVGPGDQNPDKDDEDEDNTGFANLSPPYIASGRSVGWGK